MKKGLLGFVVGCFLVMQVQAETLYVDLNSSNPTSPYTSWATAATSIQDAVDVAGDGDTVLVADGTYASGETVTPGYAAINRVCVTNAITVQSVNGPEVTIIKGVEGSNGGNDTDSVRGVYLSGGASLVGFTVTEGYSSSVGNWLMDWSGGGVWLTTGCMVSNCVLAGNVSMKADGYGGGGAFLHSGGILTDCLLLENEANSGGGATAYLVGPIIENCTFEDNSAEGRGGGVSLYSGGVLTNCTLTGNAAVQEGGGAYLHAWGPDDPAGSLDHCTLTGNSSKTSGGGAYLNNGGTLNDCTLQGNLAYEGAGGVYLFGGGETMNRCLVTENISETTGGGGGVKVSNGASILKGCRITKNRALHGQGGGVHWSSNGTFENCIVDGNISESAGGVYLNNGSTMNNCVVTKNSVTRDDGGGVYASYGTVQVNNCIVWGNHNSSGADDFWKSGSTVIDINHTCASSGVTNGIAGCMTNNPSFVNEAIGNFDLQGNSPCIDVGNNSYAPAGVDYAGNPRIVNGTVDMGAYETPALPDFSITVSAGVDGTITPESASVFQGEDQTFSMQPIVGYRVETLVVDGTSVPPVRSYTFTNVQTSHTLSATFGVNFSTLYVDDSRPDDSGDGASWATAKKTIQAAVDEVAAGGTVIVTNGIYSTGYTLTPEHTARNRVCITRAITVQSANGPEVTVIEGQRGTALDSGPDNGFGLDSIRGVYMQNNCSLAGFTIRSGFTQLNPYENYPDHFDNWGGGVWLTNGCVVSNCVIRDNSASAGGGGAYLDGGGLLENCTLIENYSEGFIGGGGASLYSGGTLNRCALMKNEANNGGGVAADNGGTLNQCYLSGNTAGRGGGMFEGTANNCTFTFNTARQEGGGMSEGTARNCILWHNTAGETGNNLYSMNTRYSCSPDLSHGSNNNVTNAPMMISTSHIATHSPCIGAGSASYASGTDIDGEAWQSPPAMGCDEVLGSVTGLIQLSVSGSEKVCEDHSATYSVEVQGAVTKTVLDFDDGTLVTNTLFSADHAWATPGTYTIILTGYNDEFPAGVSTHLTVEVYSEEAAAIHVSTTGNNANNGTSWLTAKKTIQAGVDAQKISGGIVWVTNGTYSLYRDIRIDKEVRVMSVNGPASTFVDGGGIVRCFTLGDSKCLVSGFTIQNGKVNGITPDGGYEEQGGGVECSGQNPVVSNCTFLGNWAKGSGGGMAWGTATHCIFSGNTAGGDYSSGGGMLQGVAENCLFVGNYTTKLGGGVYYTRLFNCTVVNNAAGQSGGGISRSPAYNSVIWGNTAGTSPNIYGSEAAMNLCSPDGVIHDANGCITNLPLFVDEAAEEFQLLETSPCVNLGDNAYVSSAIDLNGRTRIVDGVVDMGCYEYYDWDTDKDGLDDDWERDHFGDLSQTAEGDYDSDGSNNLHEYIAGTDPLDSKDYFRVAAMDGQLPATLYFQSLNDRQYQLFGCSNLADGLWFPVPGTELRMGVGGPDSMLDTNPVPAVRFYRLEVSQP